MPVENGASNYQGYDPKRSDPDFYSADEIMELAEADLRESKDQLKADFESGTITKEEAESMIKEALFEALLIIGANRYNEGKEAFILELRLDKLSAYILEELVSALPGVIEGDVSGESKSVVKVLKIFKHHGAADEIAKQNRAREILLQDPQTGDPDLPEVIVPQIRNSEAMSEVRISHKEAFKRKLMLPVGDRLGFIVMEKVEGDDFMTMVLRNYLKDNFFNEKQDLGDKLLLIKTVVVQKIFEYNSARFKNSTTSKKRVFATMKKLKDSSISNFQKIFSELIATEPVMLRDVFSLGQEIDAFEKVTADPEGYSMSQYIDSITDYDLLDELAVDYGGIRVGTTNTDERKKIFKKMISDYLEENAGRFVTPQQCQALREAINKWHANGFYHRDLHERNIMIGKDGNVYVIDFGKSSSTGDRSDDQSNYHIGGEEYGEKDHMLVNVGGYVATAAGISKAK